MFCQCLCSYYSLWVITWFIPSSSTTIWYSKVHNYPAKILVAMPGVGHCRTCFILPWPGHLLSNSVVYINRLFNKNFTIFVVQCVVRGISSPPISSLLLWKPLRCWQNFFTIIQNNRIKCLTEDPILSTSFNWNIAVQSIRFKCRHSTGNLVKTVLIQSNRN